MSLSRCCILTAALGRSRAGVFPILLDELALPGGSDSGLVQKLEEQWSSSTVFARTNRSGAGNRNALTFSVAHYAGQVIILLPSDLFSSSSTLPWIVIDDDCLARSSTLLMASWQRTDCSYRRICSARSGTFTQLSAFPPPFPPRAALYAVNRPFPAILSAISAHSVVFRAPQL